MKSRALAFALAVTVWSEVAQADQCDVVSERIAIAATRLINSHHEIVQFCERCGDKAPGYPEHATASVSQHLRLFEVSVGGEPIDLAYTFVPTARDGASRRTRGSGADHQYENLAALTGCKVEGVSKVLRVTEETATGVMIVPDRSAMIDVLTADPTPPAPTPSLERANAALPPQVIVVPTAASPSIWPAALAGGGGASAIWAAWAVMSTRRRRRPMRPRAAELVDRT